MERSVCWQLAKKLPAPRRRDVQRNWRLSGKRSLVWRKRRASKPRDGLRHRWRLSVVRRFVRKPLLLRRRPHHKRRRSVKSRLVRNRLAPSPQDRRQNVRNPHDRQRRRKRSRAAGQKKRRRKNGKRGAELSGVSSMRKPPSVKQLRIRRANSPSR